MTQFNSVLVAVALALTAYSGVAAWKGNAEDRADRRGSNRIYPSASLTQQ